MNKFRYWLSANLIDFAIWILPNEMVKQCMRAGLGVAADLMLREENQ